tara:strand:+ start:359 stop:1054 length:696 start_codon:yes stop_codon:yes gene_type:complete
LKKNLINFKLPPHPKGISLSGNLVSLVPLNSNKHSDDLYLSQSIDKEGANWVYLPYGPFKSKKTYLRWLKEIENKDDPVFFAVIRKSDEKAIGLASFLRINIKFGVIEVGHINFSPLLQKTLEATEVMFLMMTWVFENGFRRYEWKCNSENIRSRKAAQRLGFSYEGVFRQMSISKGKNRNTSWFAAIDKEWNDLKKAYKIYFDKNNFYNGSQIKSLSSLTEKILYKKDNL